jgi:hypothetical protein
MAEKQQHAKFQRRILVLDAHVATASTTGIAAGLRASFRRGDDGGHHHRPAAAEGSSSPAAGDGGGGGRRLLSDLQVERFVRDGFLVLRLDDIPTSAHRSIYDCCRKQFRGPITEAGLRGMEVSTGRLRHRESAPAADSAEQPTTSEVATAVRDFAAVTRSRLLLGAAESLLGTDFCAVIPSSAAATIGTGSVSTASDNQHHKDHHGDHRLRRLSYFYYPQATTVEMGCTCVVPRSQYWAIDRDTCPHAAMRLDEACLPPKSLSDWHTTLMEWSGFALSLHGKPDPLTGRRPTGEISIAARDKRIARGLELLGDPAAIDFKVVVPAGSCLLWHPDLFHRVSRSGHDGVTNHDVPMRSAIGGGFSRGSEPACAATMSPVMGESDVFDDDAVARPVWAANLAFIRGGRAHHWQSCNSLPRLTELSSLCATIGRSRSDRERTSAAYRLGWLCRTGEEEVARTAAQTLVDLLGGGCESVQRAAMFGLSVGGQAAAAAVHGFVQRVLSNADGFSEAHLDTFDDGSARGLHQSKWHIMASACFALGESVQCVMPTALASMQQIVTRATADLMAHSQSTSLEGRMDHISGAFDALSKRNDMDVISASIYDATLETDWFVYLRRRAVVAAITAAGHVGHVAVCADDASAAVRAFEVVSPWLHNPEPGANSPGSSQADSLGVPTLRQAASTACLLMVSVRMPGPSLMVMGDSRNPQCDFAVEALRRLKFAIENGKASTAQLALHQAWAII